MTKEHIEVTAVRMGKMILDGINYSSYLRDTLEEYILMAWKHDSMVMEYDIKELDAYTKRLMRRPEGEVTSVTSTDY